VPEVEMAPAEVNEAPVMAPAADRVDPVVTVPVKEEVVPMDRDVAERVPAVKEVAALRVPADTRPVVWMVLPPVAEKPAAVT